MNPRIIDDMGWDMAQVYASVTDKILVNLARHFKLISEGSPFTGAWDYQIRMLAQVGQVRDETIRILYEGLAGEDQALKGLLTEVIASAIEKTEPELRKAAEAGLLTGGRVEPVMAPNMTQAFSAYYQQSADKLNLVNTVMLESTMDVYQGTVSDIVNRMKRTQRILNEETWQVISGVSTMNQAIREGVRRMVDNGITGFVDAGGHHWSPEAYVNMDIRTTLANTGRAAVWETMEGFGDDLYAVSWHDGARPLCYPWQGKVISRSGWTGEVEDLDGDKIHVYAQSETSYGEAAGLFGINCGHYPMPFIPGFSKVRQPEQNEEQNAKEYAESQEQRRLERELREQKRDLAVLKAQGASAEEIQAQRAKVADARDRLDAFCDETGRARRTGREARPIDAKWPAGGGQVRRFNGGYVDVNKPLHVDPVPVKKTPPAQKTPPVQTATLQSIMQSVQGVSDEFKVGMAKSLEECGEERVKTLFGKYADQLVCNDDKYRKGAHFKSYMGGTYMNAEKVIQGDSLHKPYETAIHEFGHMLDWIGGGKGYTLYLSNKPVDGVRLLDTIKSDFQAFKKSLGVSRAVDVIPILKAENMSLSTRGNISDILEKCTGKSYPLGVGHGASYHKGNEATEKEFFAEVLDSVACNKEAFAQMERLFPNAVKMVFKMIEGMNAL